MHPSKVESGAQNCVVLHSLSAQMIVRGVDDFLVSNLIVGVGVSVCVK